MRIAVFDGQGAGLGQSIVRAVRQELPVTTIIIALGANTYATSQMVRSGSAIGISGEKGFVSFCRNEPIDCIIAPISIIQPGSLHGEVTRQVVHAFVDLKCRKYLIPLRHGTIRLPGLSNLPIKTCIEQIIQEIAADQHKREL